MLARIADDQAGFTLIEVLASAILIVIVATGMFTAIDAAGRTADGNKSRNVAADLAQSDQERLRGISPTQIADKTLPERTVTVDGERYKVQSAASWVIDNDLAESCSSNDPGPRYVKLRSTVTWDEMRGAKPVSSDSLRAVTNGSIPNLGNLAVSVKDRTGTAGVGGLNVSISGPKSVSQTTTSTGCVFFAYIPTGSYTLTFSRGGYIESKRPFRESISDQVTVSSDSTASKSYLYDRPGAIKATTYTRPIGGTADVEAPPASVAKFTVEHGDFGTPNTEMTTRSTSPAPANASMTTSTPLFPFSSPYSAWAGCAASKPPAAAEGSANDFGLRTSTVAPGATNSPDLRLFQPTIRLFMGYPKTLTFTNPTFRAVSSDGCTIESKPGLPYQDIGDRRYVYADFVMPYGDYTVCSSGRFVQAGHVNNNKTYFKKQAAENKTRLNGYSTMELGVPTYTEGPCT